MPYGLIFDMDGVLADTEALNVRATTAMFMELYGVAPNPEDFKPFIGKGDAAYVEGPARKLGLTIDTEKAVQRRTAIFMELLESGISIACPGVHALIDAAASDENWKLCIATSSFRDKADLTLRAAYIHLESFDAYVHGDMVTHKKPHPEIYLVAARSLRLPADRCVGVEDAPAGIEAVKAAGMKCVAVTTSFDVAALGQADLVTASLETIDLPTLEKLLG